MFTLCDTYKDKFQNLTQFLIDDVRHYGVDDQTAYPSITSVISFINRDKFAEWRKKVGLEAANAKSKKATTRGTRLHKVFEEYCSNREYESLEEYQVPLIQLMFKAAKPYLDDRIGNIYQQETRMCSHKLCLAGTVDMICDFDGELAIVHRKVGSVNLDDLLVIAVMLDVGAPNSHLAQLGWSSLPPTLVALDNKHPI